MRTEPVQPQLQSLLDGNKFFGAGGGVEPPCPRGAPDFESGLSPMHQHAAGCRTLKTPSIHRGSNRRRLALLCIAVHRTPISTDTRTDTRKQALREVGYRAERGRHWAGGGIGPPTFVFIPISFWDALISEKIPKIIFISSWQFPMTRPHAKITPDW